MGWPFGPPHLTLKPSNKKHQKNQKKKTNKKNQTKKQKKRKKRSPPKKTAKTPKNSFSVVSQIFPFWVAFQNFPFLTPWPRNCAPKKHYKNRGFRAFFWKADVRHETAIFGPKNPKFINFSYHFFLPIFFSLQNKKHTNLLKPLSL